MAKFEGGVGFSYEPLTTAADARRYAHEFMQKCLGTDYFNDESLMKTFDTVFPGDKEPELDWERLEAEVMAQSHIRNETLMATMPLEEPTRVICDGTTPGIYPVRENMFANRERPLYYSYSKHKEDQMPEKNDDLKTIHVKDELDIIDWIDDLPVTHLTSTVKGVPGIKVHFETVDTARRMAIVFKEKFGDDAFLTPFRM